MIEHCLLGAELKELWAGFCFQLGRDTCTEFAGWEDASGPDDCETGFNPVDEDGFTSAGTDTDPE